MFEAGEEVPDASEESVRSLCAYSAIVLTRCLTDMNTFEKSERTLSISSKPKVRGRLCNFRKEGCSPLTRRQMSSNTRYASRAAGRR